MNDYSEFIGQKFNKLTIVEVLPESNANGYRLARCKCVCGNERITPLANVIAGRTKSCGCYNNKAIADAMIRDLTGQRFGKLTALRPTGKRYIENSQIWECQCDCGNIVEVPSSALRSGKTKSCGCLRKEKVGNRVLNNLVGKRVGMLTVIGLTDKKYSDGSRIWRCKCDCGKELELRTTALMGARPNQSCGCLAKEHQKTAVTKYHTPYGAKLSSLLNNIRQRCNNPNDHSYPRYGGRGVKVCDEWMGDNAVFVKWAEENGYKPGLQIDRIDNNGPYSPENCRFVTPMENANNRNDHHWITVGGDRKTIAEWARLTGITAKHMYRTPEEKVINEISIAVGLKPHISDIAWMNSEKERLAVFCEEYRLL